MLGLPASTEIRKVITKKKVYEHFGAEMSTDRRKSFDADIARITLIHEISPASISIAAGETVHSFFVVLVALRKKEWAVPYRLVEYDLSEVEAGEKSIVG